MADVLLLHSIRGLRAVEKSAAERLRAAGHTVSTPDLFDGEVPETLEAAFAFEKRLGFKAIVERAAAAAASLPPEAVLAGLSLGAGVATMLWKQRPETTAVLLLHGVGIVPNAARPGTPAALHLADPDPFEDESYVTDFLEAAAERQVALETFRYPGAGHLFTDEAISDHDIEAADLLWTRVLAFLDKLQQRTHDR